MNYGRSIRQLVIVWTVIVAGMFALWFFETSAPAFHELLIPFYWILLAIGILFTWRWLKSRNKTDRRGNDRRKTPRRDHNERDDTSTQAAAPAPHLDEK